MMYSHIVHESVVADRERELERALHEARVRRERLASDQPAAGRPPRRRFRIIAVALAVTRR